VRGRKSRERAHRASVVSVAMAKQTQSMATTCRSVCIFAQVQRPTAQGLRWQQFSDFLADSVQVVARGSG
jgi:hypothetical protein